MVNVFEELITKLLEVGFYDFLIFMIALAMFYSLLKKVKLFESQIVTSVMAFCIAFLIFGYPVLLNFSLVIPMVRFFTQSFLFILVFFVATLIATFFYPDLPKFLTESFTSRGTFTVMIAIGITLAILSGGISLIWISGPATGPTAPAEISTVASGTIVFVILLIVAGSIALRQ
jgi:hypothetical protein